MLLALAPSMEYSSSGRIEKASASRQSAYAPATRPVRLLAPVTFSPPSLAKFTPAMMPYVAWWLLAVIAWACEVAATPKSATAARERWRTGMKISSGTCGTPVRRSRVAWNDADPLMDDWRCIGETQTGPRRGSPYG